MGQESKGVRCGGLGNPKLKCFGHARMVPRDGWLWGRLQHPALGCCIAWVRRGRRTSAVVTGCSKQHPLCSSLHRGGGAALLPILPKFLLCIWEAPGKSCILGFAPSGLEAAWWGVAGTVLRIHPCHAGIVMFAVGVGKAVEEELRAIASEPVEQHFSYSADFTTMTHLVENFKLNICPGGCSQP